MSLAEEVQFFNRSLKSGGDMIATAFQVTGHQAGVVAGTTQTQAGATALTHGFCEIATSANAGDVVKLPVAEYAGKMCIVTNNGANTVEVFPETDGTINGGAADAADATVIAATESRIYMANSALNWERLILEDA